MMRSIQLDAFCQVPIGAPATTWFHHIGHYEVRIIRLCLKYISSLERVSSF